MHKKCLSILFLILISLFSTITFAETISLYENNLANSKIAATVKPDDTLLVIYSPEKSEWIKVANPKTGDVGWVKQKDIKNPLVITKATGSTFQQEIIVGDKEKKPFSYHIFQYKGTAPVKQEDAKKKMQMMMKRMQKDQAEMQSFMHVMHDRMNKIMNEMMDMPEVQTNNASKQK